MVASSLLCSHWFTAQRHCVGFQDLLAAHQLHGPRRLLDDDSVSRLCLRRLPTWHTDTEEDCERESNRAPAFEYYVHVRERSGCTGGSACDERRLRINP